MFNPIRAASTVFAVIVLGFASDKVREAEVIGAIDRSQDAREEKLNGYSVTETYSIKNSRFAAALLQSSVMDRILKEETAMSRGEERKKALITSDNYTMRLADQETLNGRLCDVVELSPRSRDAHLIRGRAFVDTVTHNMVRIEGKPAASPSFWAGKPEITRDYSDIGAFAFAQRSLAVTSTFLLGRTEVIIEYTGYRIDAVE
jgi:hypothetical protein